VRKGGIPRSALIWGAVSRLDLGQHAFYVARGILTLRRALDRFEFLRHTAQGIFTARQLEGLPHPVRDGHMPGTRHELNFTIFRILQNHLQPFAHSLSMFDSSI